MRRLLLLLSLVLPAAGSEAQEIVTPSGLAVRFLDQFVEQQSDGETWLTLRYLAPAIGATDGEYGYDAVAGDIDYLCNTYGLTAATETGNVDEVIISLMDRQVARGVFDPEATAYIGAYRPAEGGCVWE